MVCGILLSFMVSLGSSDAKAGPVQECQRAIDESLKLAPHVVTVPPCNPIDPPCAALQSAAHKTAEAQNSAVDRGLIESPKIAPECRPVVSARCEAYATALARGRSDADAWSCAMSACSKTRESVDRGFSACICSRPAKLDSCPGAEARPPVMAPAPPASTNSPPKI